MKLQERNLKNETIIFSLNGGLHTVITARSIGTSIFDRDKYRHLIIDFHTILASFDADIIGWFFTGYKSFSRLRLEINCPNSPHWINSESGMHKILVFLKSFLNYFLSCRAALYHENWRRSVSCIEESTQHKKIQQEVAVSNFGDYFQLISADRSFWIFYPIFFTRQESSKSRPIFRGMH